MDLSFRSFLEFLFAAGNVFFAAPVLLLSLPNSAKFFFKYSIWQKTDRSLFSTTAKPCALVSEAAEGESLGWISLWGLVAGAKLRASCVHNSFIGYALSALVLIAAHWHCYRLFTKVRRVYWLPSWQPAGAPSLLW